MKRRALLALAAALVTAQQVVIFLDFTLNTGPLDELASSAISVALGWIIVKLVLLNKDT